MVWLVCVAVLGGRAAGRAGAGTGSAGDGTGTCSENRVEGRSGHLYHVCVHAFLYTPARLPPGVDQRFVALLSLNFLWPC